MFSAEIGQVFYRHLRALMPATPQTQPCRDAGEIEIDQNGVVTRHCDPFLSDRLRLEENLNERFCLLLKPFVRPDEYYHLASSLDPLLHTRGGNAPGRLCLEKLRIAVPGFNGKAQPQIWRLEFARKATVPWQKRWRILIRDITPLALSLEQQQRHARKAERQKTILIGLTRHEPDIVADFLHAATRNLKILKQQLAFPTQNESEVRQRLSEMYGIMHQIKGDAAVLGLDDLAHTAHEFENLLSTLVEAPQVSAKCLTTLAPQLKRTIYSLREVNGIFRQLNEGRGELAESTSESSGLLRRVKSLVERLAKDEGKQVQVVAEACADSQIPTHLRRVINSLITQLTRNSIVHGLESPTERKKSQKTSYGLFHITVRAGNDMLEVAVRDDGRGLDVEGIRNSALRSEKLRGMGVARWSTQRLVALIFQPGFSTKENSTLHAGRGVGLDVIKRTTERYGGRIQVATVAGQFTEFRLVFPMAVPPTLSLEQSLPGNPQRQPSRCA